MLDEVVLYLAKKLWKKQVSLFLPEDESDSDAKTILMLDVDHASVASFYICMNKQRNNHQITFID